MVRIGHRHFVYELDRATQRAALGPYAAPWPILCGPGALLEKSRRRENHYCYLLKVHFYIYTADFLFCASELPVCNLYVHSNPWSYQELYIIQCLHVVGNSFRTSLTGHLPPFSSPEHGISTRTPNPKTEEISRSPFCSQVDEI